jgi:hypothetical protein
VGLEAAVGARRIVMILIWNLGTAALITGLGGVFGGSHSRAICNEPRPNAESGRTHFRKV